jgi:hypothetical protein
VEIPSVQAVLEVPVDLRRDDQVLHRVVVAEVEVEDQGIRVYGQGIASFL